MFDLSSISPEKKIILHHIPKCGGTSLRVTLRTALMCSGVRPEHIYLSNGHNPNIMSLSDLSNAERNLAKSCAVLAHIDARLIHKLNGNLIITIIRHPIHRAFSAFNHFVLMDNPESEDLVTIFKNKRETFDRMFGNLYSTSGPYGLKHVNYSFVLIYERLNNDIHKMLKSLGFPKFPIPNIDPSPASSQNHPNRFKFNEHDPDHIEIWNYLKERLSDDIAMYEDFASKN
jgi:hypothetical protein